MNLILTTFSNIISELILILGALLFLLLGVFSKKNSTNAICYGAIILVISAIVLMLIYPSHNQTLFFDIYIVNSKILVLIGAICIFVMLAAVRTDKDYFSFETPILILLSISGMLFLINSQDLLTFYLGLELMSLPLCILATCDHNNLFSSEAGLKYFILSSISSGIYLFGSSFVYGSIGDGNFISIFKCIEVNSLLLLIGLLLIIISIYFKISAAPFHMWAPDVYQGSPTMISTLFASLPKVTVLTFFARFFCDFLYVTLPKLTQVIIIASIASMFIGSLGAIFQTNIKRMLAYSSISHIGFSLMGIVTGGTEGAKILYIYTAIYLCITIGIFSCLLMLNNDEKYQNNIYELQGLAQQKPSLAFMIAILVFSLAGIPPFAGFFTKFYAIYFIIGKGLYLYAIAAVVASTISLFYYLRIVKIMYFDATNNYLNISLSLGLRIIASIAVIINIIYILFPINYNIELNYSLINNILHLFS